VSWKRQIKEYNIEFHGPFDVLIPSNAYFMSVGIVSSGIFPQDDHPRTKMWWMVEDENKKTVKTKFIVLRANVVFDVKHQNYLATFMFKGEAYFLFQFAEYSRSVGVTTHDG